MAALVILTISTHRVGSLQGFPRSALLKEERNELAKALTVSALAVFCGSMKLSRPIKTFFGPMVGILPCSPGAHRDGLHTRSAFWAVVKCLSTQ